MAIDLDSSHHKIPDYLYIPLCDALCDPFDRMILATALAEQMMVISANKKFKRYHCVVKVNW